MSTGATPTAAGISGEIPFPRYHQVQLALRQRILDDVYESLIPMPGERELGCGVCCRPRHRAGRAGSP